MKIAYLSKLAYPPLIEYLKDAGLELLFLTGEDSPVYDAVKTHADIHMCRLGVWEVPRLFMGDPARLTKNYPGNIRCNAVCTGKYFIHNLRYTDPALLQAAKEWHSSLQDAAGGEAGALTFVDVPQGYTRCCCLPVDDSSFITSDEGIAKALSPTDADVLLIEKGHILLPGFDYGFIGGCAGHLTETDSVESPHGSPRRIILFNGDLSRHPDFLRITAFLDDRGIAPVFFEDHPLMDIGSILIK